MSYTSIAAAAQSSSLRERIAACIATQPNLDDHPLNIANRIIWQCAGEPGWGDAWASAVAAGSPDPGADPAVITDGQILAAVQKHLGSP